ncbi:MAG: ABC transporter ATP-binding protein [Spirochaetales bacterium]|nr:ABC transporter ATP-binding protein [Spirochaetales bacterium]
MELILEVRNFELVFNRYDYSRLQSNFLERSALKIISRFDLGVKKGELLAIIGSSGAGKSLLAHAILGILPSNAGIKGEILFNGKVLTSKVIKELRGNRIVLVPQSVGFLNPLKTAGWQIQRASVLAGRTKKEARLKTIEALNFYNLSPDVCKLYPFRLSGGMARRVLAASTYVTNADLFIADEPTTGLDAEAVEESLYLLKKLTAGEKSVILITHDLKAALKVSDRIAVFYGGTIVEITEPVCFSDESFLSHPYSKALFKALPENDFLPFPGENPFGSFIPEGCVFEPRCQYKGPECLTNNPGFHDHAHGQVRCFYA